MTDNARPHLTYKGICLACPVTIARDSMTDEEYWADVADSLTWRLDDIGSPEYDTPASLDATPCRTCGEAAACAWDSEGRPLFHDEDEDDS